MLTKRRFVIRAFAATVSPLAINVRARAASASDQLIEDLDLETRPAMPDFVPASPRNGGSVTRPGRAKGAQRTMSGLFGLEVGRPSSSPYTSRERRPVPPSAMQHSRRWAASLHLQ